MRSKKSLSSGEQTSAREGFLACVPTVIGYWSVGLAAGVLSYIAGLSVAEVALLSALLYAGSGQFIFAQMTMASSSPFTFLSTTFFVNLRHVLMSLYISQKFERLTLWQAIVIGNHITDESFGVASIQARRQEFLSFRWMFALNTTAYVNWFLGNVVGALWGSLIPEDYILPLQFSLAGMFLGLVAQQIHSSDNRFAHVAVAVIALLMTLLLTIVFDKHSSLIPVSLLASFAGLLMLRLKRS